MSSLHCVATIKLAAAQELIRGALCYARQDLGESASVACSVVDSAGNLVAFAAHDECAPLPRNLSTKKAHTALILRRTTQQVREGVLDGRIDLVPIGDDDLVAMPGGAPLIHDGVIVGAIGISGLPPEDDARIADFAAMEYNASQRSDTTRNCTTGGLQ